MAFVPVCGHTQHALLTMTREIQLNIPFLCPSTGAKEVVELHSRSVQFLSILEKGFSVQKNTNTDPYFPNFILYGQICDIFKHNENAFKQFFDI